MPVLAVPAPPAGQFRKSAVFKIGLNLVKHGETNHGFGSMGPIDIHAVNPNSPFTPPEVRIVGTPVAYVDSIDVIRPNHPVLHVALPPNTTQIDLMATAAGPILKMKEPVTIQFHLHLVSNLGVSVMSTGFNVFARGTPWAELYYYGQLDLEYATAIARPA